MTYLEIFALAIALSMDALAVAAATGLRMRCGLGQTIRMGAAFGFFQFIMPVLGWFLGSSVQGYIETFDHWVAFGLLMAVGVKMLREAWKGDEVECADPTRGLTLLLLALATSIDALAVGISLAVLQTEIWQPAVIIGVICFAITALGMHLGRAVVKNGSKLGAKASAMGGLVLLALGVKILYEHHVFS